MTNLRFSHITLAQRVLFGAGMAPEHLTGEINRIGAERVMVITSASRIGTAQRIASGIEVTSWYDDVAMHVPIDNAQRARAAADAMGIDAIVSVGGGSTTGLAKVIALTTGTPVIAVPTTYSGSEATPVWGLTEAGQKTTGSDEQVLPKTVIYDSELTLSLPVELSVSSGLNAMAHCIDTLWAPRADPINAALATEAIHALAEGLTMIVAAPDCTQGRDQVLHGTYLSGVAFASAGSGMHHKICHMLGGTFGLPHAQTHATVLPYVLAFNAPAAPQAEARIAQAFGSQTALGGLQQLRTRLGAPTALADYGFTAENIAEAVQVGLGSIPQNNPRKVFEADLSALLTAAMTGDDPAALTHNPLPDEEPTKGLS